jgi:uncharacterized surface protein with fasciclin (FAS1) repeats
MKARLLAGVALAVLVGFALPGRGSDTVSIAEAVAGMKEHTVLAAAIAESGEYKALKGPGPFTLFAPTDAAFKKLDDGTIRKVATDKDQLKQLLRAHVVSGKFAGTDLKKFDGKEVKTLSGSAFKVEDTKDGLKVGGAKVVGEVVCGNGTIFVIDAVLTPPK